MVYSGIQSYGSQLIEEKLLCGQILWSDTLPRELEMLVLAALTLFEIGQVGEDPKLILPWPPLPALPIKDIGDRTVEYSLEVLNVGLCELGGIWAFLKS